MLCVNCNTKMIEGANFCMNCGSEAIKEIRCKGCNEVLPKEAKFCFKCGVKVGEVTSLNYYDETNIEEKTAFSEEGGLNSQTDSFVELGNQIENITMSSNYRSVRGGNSIFFLDGTGDNKLWELKGLFNKTV